MFRRLSIIASRAAALVLAAGFVAASFVTYAQGVGTAPIADWSTSASVTAPSAVIVSTTGTGLAQIQVTGTFTGLSFTVQGSIDGSNWFNIPAVVMSTQAGVTAGTALTSTGNWGVTSAGFLFVRANVSAISTGTAVFAMRAGAGAPGTVATAGGGGSTSVTQGTSPWVVSGTTTLGAGTASAGKFQMQGKASGATTDLISCDSSTTYDASTNGKTQLVGLTSSQNVYVCGYTIFAAGTVNVSLSSGTGTNCGTTSTNITPAFQLTAQTGAVDGSPFYRGLKANASEELCLVTNAAVAVQAIVYYTKF